MNSTCWLAPVYVRSLLRAKRELVLSLLLLIWLTFEPIHLPYEINFLLFFDLQCKLFPVQVRSANWILNSQQVQT